jgi:glycosyltransferase involved in cell wall biosynthesis
MFALAVAKCFSLPVVATCHGFTPNDRRLRFYCAVDALVLRAFTRVIAVSAQMKADLIAGGIDATRVDVVTNAVASVSDDERELVRTQARRRLGIDHECFVFGYVGRLSDEKGVDYLLQALKAWPRPYDSMRLLVVGDGPRRQPLETLAHEWGLNEVVRFVGFQPDAAPWYSAMDAFVLPSLTEGTPMALLEAMAHGLPAIGTRVGGVPAVITDSVNGLLVPPADPAKLLKAMQVVTASAQLRDILSRGARESIRVTFNVVDWVHRVRAVYMKTLDGIR